MTNASYGTYAVRGWLKNQSSHMLDGLALRAPIGYLLPMSKNMKRQQASKRVRHGVGPDSMGRAFIELRQGSRTSPHRDKTVYSRRDRWEDSAW